MTDQRISLPPRSLARKVKQAGFSTLKRSLRRFDLELFRTGQDDSGLLAVRLMKLFDQYNIGTVLDVGARHGEYGSFLRKHGFRGNIISFEPVASNFANLEAAAFADDQWRTVNLALGSSEEKKIINVTEFSVFSSLRVPTSAVLEWSNGGAAVASREEINVCRLDSIWAGLLDGAEGNVYLKSDTQGWELEVLAGASGIIDQVAAMQLEVSNGVPIYDGAPTMSRSLEAVKSLGFELSAFFPVNMSSQLVPKEFDCIVVRKQ